MFKESRLILPRRMCGDCGSDRIWKDFKEIEHCWECEPPGEYVRRMKDGKKHRQRQRDATDHAVQRETEDEGRRGAVIPESWS